MAAKKPRTREDWERGWRYIGPVFGDVDPKTVDLRTLDDWYRQVLRTAGVREAWRAMKIWRALWQAAAALRYCDKDKDSSIGIRRQTPAPRQAVWHEHEVTHRVK